MKVTQRKLTAGPKGDQVPYLEFREAEVAALSSRATSADIKRAIKEHRIVLVPSSLIVHLPGWYAAEGLIAKAKEAGHTASMVEEGVVLGEPEWGPVRVVR